MPKTLSGKSALLGLIVAGARVACDAAEKRDRKNELESYNHKKVLIFQQHTVLQQRQLELENLWWSVRADQQWQINAFGTILLRKIAQLAVTYSLQSVLPIVGSEIATGLEAQNMMDAAQTALDFGNMIVSLDALNFMLDDLPDSSFDSLKCVRATYDGLIGLSGSIANFDLNTASMSQLSSFNRNASSLTNRNFANQQAEQADIVLALLADQNNMMEHFASQNSGLIINIFDPIVSHHDVFYGSYCDSGINVPYDDGNGHDLTSRAIANAFVENGYDTASHLV